jgi:hypothetical protein
MEGQMKVQIGLALAFFALAPVAATAETQEEQQACMDDAFNVCGDAIPDRDRVAACLAHNISKISAACRTVMLSYQKPETIEAVSGTPMNIKPKRARLHGRIGDRAIQHDSRGHRRQANE